MTGRRQDRDREFVRDVLARTSGSACDRACGLLPDLADGALATLDRQLVQRHLEHCAGCRAVALALGWLAPELAARAELDPGPDFTAAVVARTSGAGAAAQARRARQVAAAGPGGALDRLARWWSAGLQRPGFAVQIAYAAALVLMLLTATPVSPLRGPADRLLAVASAGPLSLPPVADAAAWLDEQAGVAAGSARGAADAGLDGLTAELTRRLDRSAPPRRLCADRFAAAASELRAGSFGDAGRDFLDALHAGRDAWHLMWTTHPANDG